MSNTSRFVISIHRRPDSLFGAASNPVIRNGALLFFDEEDCARAECDRLNAYLSNPQTHYTVEFADAGPQAVCTADWATAREANTDGRPK